MTREVFAFDVALRLPKSGMEDARKAFVCSRDYNAILILNVSVLRDRQFRAKLFLPDQNGAGKRAHSLLRDRRHGAYLRENSLRKQKLRKKQRAANVRSLLRGLYPPPGTSPKRAYWLSGLNARIPASVAEQ